MNQGKGPVGPQTALFSIGLAMAREASIVEIMILENILSCFVIDCNSDIKGSLFD